MIKNKQIKSHILFSQRILNLLIVAGFVGSLFIGLPASADTINVYPNAKGGGDDTGDVISDITADDTAINPDTSNTMTTGDGAYTVRRNDVMNFSGFDTSGIPAGSIIDGVVLHLEYGATDDYSGTNYVTYGAGSSNTSIKPTDVTGFVTASYDIYTNDATAVNSLYKVTNLVVGFSNNDLLAGGIDAIHFDYLYLTVDYTEAEIATSTISGTVYSDEGQTAVGSGVAIQLAIGTSTVGIMSTTTDSAGDYTFYDVPVEREDQLLGAFVNGSSTFKAYSISKIASSTTSINDFDLYQDNVIVRSDNGSPVSVADLEFYQNGDDGDVSLLANSASGTVSVLNGQTLYVWPDTTFVPAASSTYSGSLNNQGTYDAASETYIYLTGTDKELIGELTGTSSLGTLDVVGSYTFSSTTTLVGLNIFSNATVTAPTTLTIEGSLNNKGTFIHNDGTVLMSGNSPKLNINTFTFATSTNLSAQDGTIIGIAFSNDGDKMFMVGNDNDTLYEYDLALPFDVSTASSTASLNLSSKDSTMQGLEFSPDGYKFYIIGRQTDTIYEYRMTTAFDISTALFEASLSIGSYEGLPRDIIFSTDGRRFYFSSFSTTVYEFYVTVPFDISTAVYAHTFATPDTAIGGLAFSTDGTQAVTGLGLTGNTIYLYDLSRPFDLTSATVNGTTTIPTSGSTLTNIELLNKENKIYFSYSDTDTIYQYDMNNLAALTDDASATTPLQLNDLTVTGPVAANKATTTNLIIDTDGTLGLTNELTITGNYTNEGNFVAAGSSEVIFAGNSTQTASGTMTTTTGRFNNLTLSNTSANGYNKQSIIFSGAVLVNATSTITPGTSVQFSAGPTPYFSAEHLDWQGGDTDSIIYLRSSEAGTDWRLIGTADGLVNYVDVKDSDASSAGSSIVSDDSYDRGNNTNWTFNTPLTQGGVVIAEHNNTQVGNNFNFQNKTNETLFAFKLIPDTGTTSINNLSLYIGGYNINTADFSNIRLLRDINADAAYDAGDVQVGGSGVMSMSGQNGTIAFSTAFFATTTQNYIVVADWNMPASNASLLVDLFPKDILGTYSAGPYLASGSVKEAQHSRSSSGGGSGGSGGGFSSLVGDTAPAGDGEVGGGTNVGGEVIGSDPNFKLPTANSGSWTNASNAYDATDGTYASANSAVTHTFSDYNFVVNSGNRIDGIVIKMEVSATTPAGDIAIDLSYNGGSNWTTPVNTPTLTGTDTVITLGTPSYLWDRGWTAAEFSNANFRLRVTGNPSSNTIQIDELQVRVYHSTSGGGAGGGGAI